MKFLVILNPYSGRWRGGKERLAIEQALRRSGLEFEILETHGPGEARSLAQEISGAASAAILVAGGDGTISEVVNGLFAARPEGRLGPIGILPTGTANDLVVNLGLPTDYTEVIELARGGHVRTIDLGMVNGTVFDNNSAVGLEPVVTIYNIRMRRLRGVIRYLVAALRAILAKGEWQMRLAWDDGSYEGPVSLVSVGNGAITGGLFHMAPAADPCDGRLTFVYGYARTRRKMLGLLPRTMDGSFVDDPVIHQHHTTRLMISSDPPTPLQADGEIRDEAASEVTYEILPARLDVFSP